MEVEGIDLDWPDQDMVITFQRKRLDPWKYEERCSLYFIDQRNYNINLQLISWVFYPATINATCILTWASKSISVLVKMSSIKCWGEVDTCRSLINTIGSALSVSLDVEQKLLSITNLILYIKILLNRVIDSHYSFTHWVKSVDFSWWWLLITSTATIWELNIYDDLH